MDIWLFIYASSKRVENLRLRTVGRNKKPLEIRLATDFQRLLVVAPNLSRCWFADTFNINDIFDLTRRPDPAMNQQEERARRIRFQGRIGRKLVLSFVLLVMAMVAGSGWVLFELTEFSLEQQMGQHLVSEAELLSLLHSGDLIRRYVDLLHSGFVLERYSSYQNIRKKYVRAKEMLGARRIYIFDRQGRKLLGTDDDGVRIGREYHHLRISDSREVERVWQEGVVVHTVPFDDPETNIDYMTGYAPIFAGGEVVAVVGVDIGQAYVGPLRVFKRSVYIFAAVGALLTIVVGLALSRTITQPIQRLVQAAREIGRGNLGQVVNTDVRDELGYLGETMDEMRKRLLARDEQLRQMLGGVAHEIRNPLGGIEIYAGLIADDLPEGDPRKQHIQKVIGEVRQLNLVISEFLDFARPAPAAPEPTPVLRLAEDAAFLLAPEMEKAGVAYHQEVDPELEIDADPEQVKRALLNLMKNAVQAMRQGGDLWVRAQRDNGQVVVEVEDSGPGIGREQQEHLFEPFYSTKEKGSGLGLAIVQQTVEKNRGWVRVQSREGEGTRFSMVLPGVEREYAEQVN